MVMPEKKHFMSFPNVAFTNITNYYYLKFKIMVIYTQLFLYSERKREF